MQKIALKSAGPAQIEEFARVKLGLDTAAATNRAKLLALLAEAGYDKDFIEIDEDTPVPLTRQNVEIEKGAGLDPNRKVRIMLHVDQSPGGDEPYPVLVNGRRMDIPRGEIVEVPYAYVHVLENARGVGYEPTETEGLGRAREYQRIPFSVYPDA